MSNFAQAQSSPPEAASSAPAQPAAAPEFSSAQQAQVAADAAKAERAAAIEAYQARIRECMHKFFVTRCTEEARTERNDVVERADGLSQRAELFVRQDKSREHRERLAAENAKRDARDAEKAAELRQTEAANRIVPTPAPATDPARTANPAVREPREARPEDDPAVRARNRAAYDRKQEEARIYAEKQARERAENEDKRSRRRAQREADAAKFRNPEATAPANPGANAPANPTMAK